MPDFTSLQCQKVAEENYSLFAALVRKRYTRDTASGKTHGMSHLCFNCVIFPHQRKLKGDIGILCSVCLSVSPNHQTT